ncbi:MAG TPA: hypothetical protein VGK93_02320 [Candidatus Eisenbacteria bacterium]|jgi:hypothetical protein
MRILYFDLDGTLIHLNFGNVKNALARGAFERAVRTAEFERLVCIGNAMGIITLLEETGREPDGHGMLMQLCGGAFVDERWLRSICGWVRDPKRRVRELAFDQDWWCMDDMATRYFELDGRADLLGAHRGGRILESDPVGEGHDILKWLEGIKREHGRV